VNAIADRDLIGALVDADVVDIARADELATQAPPPWWLALLQGIAAWVASLMIISSFFAPLLLIGDGAIARVTGGAVLLGVAIWLFGRGHFFTAQMALAFSLAGQGLVIGGIGSVMDDPFGNYRVLAAVGAILAAAMMLPPSTPLHRTICGLLICVFAGAMIGPGNGLAIYAAVLLIAATAAWAARPRWVMTEHAAPARALLNAATLAALVAAWLVGVEGTRAALIAGLGLAATTQWPALYPTAAGTTLILLVAWLTREAGFAPRAAALAASGAFVLAAGMAPGLIASAAVLLAVFQACHRVWIALALLAAVVYLSEFYYSLHISLLAKSGTLALTGLVLLALWYSLRRWQGSLR
jgi:hypothetical protein